ncbi:hypothetical protein GA0115240_176312, partial [Streptomyces sp. DvalAA-14]
QLFRHRPAALPVVPAASLRGGRGGREGPDAGGTQGSAGRGRREVGRVLRRAGTFARDGGGRAAGGCFCGRGRLTGPLTGHKVCKSDK